MFQESYRFFKPKPHLPLIRVTQIKASLPLQTRDLPRLELAVHLLFPDAPTLMEGQWQKPPKQQMMGCQQACIN